MRWLKRFSIITILALLSILVAPVSIAYAVSPSVDNVKVFTGYMEEGDWLIVAVYNISGGNTSTSLCGITTYTWKAQLINTVSGTAYANKSLEQCGMKPIGIYINQSMASTLEWGTDGEYSFKIIGNWGSSPSATKLINASDWRGEIDKGYLDDWVLEQAEIIEAYYSADYLDSCWDEGLCLTYDGGYVFETGIEHLIDYRDNLFAVTQEHIDVEYEENNTDMTYADDLYDEWDDTLGPDVSASLTSAGTYFGINGRLMGAILTLMGFLAIAIIEKTIAFMIILGGVMIGVFPMATVFVLVFILMILLIRSLFWSST